MPGRHRDSAALFLHLAAGRPPSDSDSGSSIPANINAYLSRPNNVLYVRVTDFAEGPLPGIAMRAWAAWNSVAAASAGIAAARNATITSAEATVETSGWWEAQLANTSVVAVLSLTATADITNATVQLLDDNRDVLYTWAAPSAAAGAPLYFWAAETCVDAAGEFSSFMAKAGKRYASAEEAAYRFRVFNATLDMVSKFNSRGNASWAMAVNHMSDLTEEELAARFYGLRADPNAPPSVGGRVLRSASSASSDASGAAAAALAQAAAGREESDAAVAAASAIDAAAHSDRGRALQTTVVDWTTKANVVGPVRSQNSGCNSCWAFAAAAAIESAGALAGRGLRDLSEQMLIDCTLAPVTANMGCFGGDYKTGMAWVASSSAGMCLEADYPYQANNCGQCKPCTAAIPVSRIVAMSSSARDTDVETALKVQPIAVGIYSTSPFVYYSSGIYNDASCAGSTSPNHAMLLVGTGTDASRKAFWKVKNRWGTGWGEAGYARIFRGSGANCKLTNNAAYPVVPALPSATATITATPTRTRSPGSASPTRSPASATPTPTKTATQSRTPSATRSRTTASPTPTRSPSRIVMGMGGPAGAVAPAAPETGDVGAIIGGVVGGVAAVGLVVGGFVLSRRRRASAAAANGQAELLASPRRVAITRGGPGGGDGGGAASPASSPTSRRPVVRTASPVAAAAGASSGSAGSRGRSAARPAKGGPHASAVSPRSASASGAGSGSGSGSGVRTPRATHSLAHAIGAPAAAPRAAAHEDDDADLLASNGSVSSHGSGGSSGGHFAGEAAGSRSSRRLTEEELAQAQAQHNAAQAQFAAPASGAGGRAAAAAAAHASRGSLVPASFGLSAYRGGKVRGVGMPHAASGSAAASAGSRGGRAYMAPLATPGEY